MTTNRFVVQSGYEDLNGGSSRCIGRNMGW